MRNRVRLAAIALLLAFHLAVLTDGPWAKTSRNPEGLANFGHVTDTLYRGAQPSDAGFKALKQMGVSIVVNFRDEGWERANEKKEVESLGMRYVGIPWRATHAPADAQVVEFLDLVRTNPDVKIFVHCQRGADRTGTMIAVYRIVVEHKPATDAVSEMREYHYARYWLPGLESYVLGFPKLLQTDPRFATYSTSFTPNSAPQRPVVPTMPAAAVPITH